MESILAQSKIDNNIATMPKKVIPGVHVPIRAKSGPVRVEAWKDTDIKGAKPKYFVSVDFRNDPSHEFHGLSPARVRALGLALIAVADGMPRKKPRA